MEDMIVQDSSWLLQFFEQQGAVKQSPTLQQLIIHKQWSWRLSFGIKL